MTPRTILIFSRIDFAWLNPILMSRLRARYGVRFVIIVPSPKWADFYEEHCQAADRIICSQDVEAEVASRTCDEDLEFEKARQNEQKYDVVYLRDILQQARDISARWLQYAPNSPFSRLVPPPLSELCKRTNAYLAYFEDLFDRENIDLVIERPGDLFSTACIVAAGHRRIPTTFWLPARHKSFVMWSVGPYLGHDLIQAKYQELADQPPVPLDDIQPPDDSKPNFEKARKLRSVSSLARQFYTTTRDHTIWTARGILFGAKLPRLTFRAVMRYHLSVWSAHRAIARLVVTDPTEIRSQPFVLFLLQFEPEYTTLSLARHFNDTRALVQQLSLSMPAGHRLVLKENVNSIGNRALSFYRGLMGLPNVVLADHAIPATELIVHAQAVATVSSTGALEANLFGKPAFIFAQGTEFSFLPDIHTVGSFAELPAMLRKITTNRSPEEQDSTRRHASRYRRAIELISFDAPSTRPFRGTKTTITDTEAEKAVDRLIDCYRIQLGPRRVSPLGDGEQEHNLELTRNA